MADPTKPPADPKAAPAGDKVITTAARFINPGQVTDSTGLPQQLQNGIALKAGQIDLTGVVIDSIQGVGALFISDDETVVLGATPVSAVGSGATGLEAPVTWRFRWDAVPAFGLGVLRLIEMTVDPTGAELSFSVCVVEDPQTDPVAIGTPDPGP